MIRVQEIEGATEQGGGVNVSEVVGSQSSTNPENPSTSEPDGGGTEVAVGPASEPGPDGEGGRQAAATDGISYRRFKLRQAAVPALVELVMAGKVELADAEAIAGRSRGEQETLAAQGPGAVKQIAGALRAIGAISPEIGPWSNSSSLGTGPLLKASDSVRELDACLLSPSPENELIYRPVHGADPDIDRLAEDIEENGVLEPLVVTSDGYVLSGHRRLAAAKIAGLATVPCRVVDVCREGRDRDEYVQRLAAYNQQRVKTFDEVLREEILRLDPPEAYRSLRKYRREMVRQSCESVTTVALGARKTRATISPAKKPLLNAVNYWLDQNRDFWPLTDRRVHYLLLNPIPDPPRPDQPPPLRHARKPASTYRNDPESYKDLCNLLTRARLTGQVPWEAIEDPTRPVTTWDVHPNVASYVRAQLEGFLSGYWRDLQLSQPAHIEIVGEKNTVANILEPVAQDYCIPCTLGRGYASLDPRKKMVDRFRKSGRDRLVILIVSDFDPEGEDIARSFPQSLRDDFGVKEVKAIKVALTKEQIRDLNLPEATTAKINSSRYEKFAKQHGEIRRRNGKDELVAPVWELEAVPATQLQTWLRGTIESVLNMDALRNEQELEESDSVKIQGIRAAVLKMLSRIGMSH